MAFESIWTVCFPFWTHTEMQLTNNAPFSFERKKEKRFLIRTFRQFTMSVAEAKWKMKILLSSIEKQRKYKHEIKRREHRIDFYLVDAFVASISVGCSVGLNDTNITLYIIVLLSFNTQRPIFVDLYCHKSTLRREQLFWHNSVCNSESTPRSAICQILK